MKKPAKAVLSSSVVCPPFSGPPHCPAARRPCMVAALLAGTCCNCRMARDVVDMTPIESRDELVAWFAEGVKPKQDFRIGTEHEKFAFTTADRRPVPYEGRRSIRALLEGMQHLLGWEPILEH